MAKGNTVHFRARTVDFGLQSQISGATDPLYLVAK